MRRILAVASLLLLSGCAALNPVAAMQEAGRQLRFSLDRVEPRLELAFPLEQSRLVLKMDLGVENPTEYRLRTRKVSGALKLAQGGGEHAIGTVAFPVGMDLASKQRSTLVTEVGLSYADIKAAWNPIKDAVVSHHAATWKLGGEARFEALGIEFGVPFNASKNTGK
ncbi:MAG TPA: hypothetical protein VJ483_04020 [Holophagaceae bacterium]|nr:hypothetical protein [Holophagaceae bacterium]